MQNKILRIVSFKCLKDHVNMSELCKAKNILQTNDIFKLEMAKFVHSYFHQNLPENFANYFCSAVIIMIMLPDLLPTRIIT